MTRRTRIEYTTTHMTSEAQPRLSSTARSLMVDSPWGRNAWAPHSGCHRTDAQVLGTDLNCSESDLAEWWRSSHPGAFWEPSALRDFSPVFVRFGSKADITRLLSNVRFTPQSGQTKRRHVGMSALCQKQTFDGYSINSSAP